MTILVFDCEADGFLEEVENIWCISGTVLHIGGEQEKLRSITPEEMTKDRIMEFFGYCDVIVCHNMLKYDVPLIQKMFGFDIRKGRVLLDTLVMSKLANPDRRLPTGCPTSIHNHVTGRGQAVRPHGLEAWGYRMGLRKLQVDDWRTYTPEMVERCEGDVEINVKVFRMLTKEMRLEEYEQYFTRSDR